VRFNSGMFVTIHVRQLLSLCLLSKIDNSKIKKSITLTFVMYGCVTWSPPLVGIRQNEDVLRGCNRTMEKSFILYYILYHIINVLKRFYFKIADMYI
jgi:hypothetical protein